MPRFTYNKAVYTTDGDLAFIPGKRAPEIFENPDDKDKEVVLLRGTLEKHLRIKRDKSKTLPVHGRVKLQKGKAYILNFVPTGVAGETSIQSFNTLQFFDRDGSKFQVFNIARRSADWVEQYAQNLSDPSIRISTCFFSFHKVDKLGVTATHYEAKDFARALIAINEKGVVTYAEVVPDLNLEPNYQACFASLCRVTPPWPVEPKTLPSDREVKEDGERSMSGRNKSESEQLNLSRLTCILEVLYKDKEELSTKFKFYQEKIESFAKLIHQAFDNCKNKILNKLEDDVSIRFAESMIVNIIISSHFTKEMDETLIKKTISEAIDTEFLRIAVYQSEILKDLPRNFDDLINGLVKQYCEGLYQVSRKSSDDSALAAETPKPMVVYSALGKRAAGQNISGVDLVVDRGSSDDELSGDDSLRLDEQEPVSPKDTRIESKNGKR